MSLQDALATPERRRRYVQTLFHTIAGRYDLITILLSFGLDRRWKRRLVRLADVTPGVRALDLATGTGDIAFALSRASARVVGLDFVPAMIALAASKVSGGHAPRFVVGDMTALPFPDRSFGRVTTGYGLRNVPDLARALDEIHRVLEPGGQMVSLDFDRPSAWWLRGVYLCYLSVVGGVLGRLLHGDPDTYRYIPASIRVYPGGAAVARMMMAQGFTNVTHHRVLGGLMAIHHGCKPCT
jgi:demethylmenaquinone methyltransferase/2-methoxy-6-polyprenyl-1,4-benzoquinol methylase